MRLKLFGANGSPRIWVTRADFLCAFPVNSASTSSPAFAAPTSPICVSNRAFLSTDFSQKRPFSPPSSTPNICALPLANFFITCATWPLPRSSVRANMRSPMPKAPRLPLASMTRILGKGMPSASQCSGTATALSPSIATILSTVTLGTPPIL